MKKSLLLLSGIALFAMGSVFTGCSKDEDEPTPSPTVAMVTPGNTATAAIGTDVDIKVLAAAPSGKKLKSFQVTFSTDGSNYTPLSAAFAGNKSDTTLNTANYTFERTITAGTPGTYYYKFTAVDGDNASGSAVFKLTVTGAAGAIKTSSAKLLGGQTNAAAGSFYSTSDETVYTSTTANSNQSKIDFVYFYGTANGATMAAPIDAEAQTAHQGNTTLNSWTTKNLTKFATTALNAAAFDAITDDAAIVPLAATANNTKANQLSVGQVVAFVTAGNKKGLFKVVSITGTSGTDRAIEIVVKVQN